MLTDIAVHPELPWDATQDLPAGTVTVVDTALPGHDRPAHLVRRLPSGAPAPAVLWLHWLGNERSDRSQFLAEAIDLASLGCVSLLPTGIFPWHQDPTGTPADRELVADELQRVVSAHQWLTRAPGVDPDRVAVVGHDYGAMYALGAGGLGARAVVAIAPDRDWTSWFRRYWLGDPSPDPAYEALFGDVDPVSGADRCQDDLLLQWAELDEYVPRAVPEDYAAAAPLARTLTYPARDHRVGGHAPVQDRREFLVERLGLGPT